MKISWKKIGLVVMTLVLAMGLFGKPVSAAESSFLKSSIAVESADEAIKLASEVTAIERIETLFPGVGEREITSGTYKGKKVLAMSVTGEGYVLCSWNGTDLKPLKMGDNFFVIDDSGALAYKEEGGVTKALETLTDPLAAAGEYVKNESFKLAMTVFSWILANVQLLFAYILQWLMYFMDVLLNAGNVLNNKGVHSGWTAVRDLCNMLFILILLVIAFMTVFMGTENSSYSIKKALPMLIIAVLTINFSFLMCRIIVEGADIVSRNFVAEGEAGKLGDIMGITELGSIKVPSTEAGGETLENLLTGSEKSSESSGTSGSE